MRNPDVRVSDEDRDRVLLVLREHYAIGRLDDEELDQRIAAVHTARTWRDLAEVTADLPPLPRGPLSAPDAPVASDHTGRDGTPDGLATTALVLGLTGFCGVTAVLAIACGATALRKAGDAPQADRGKAAAGLILGIAWLVVFGIVMLA